jgi:hypothetical protein
MSARDARTRGVISGHTGGEGGGIDVHAGARGDGTGPARAPRLDGGIGSPRWGESTLGDGHANGSRSMPALLRELSIESGNLVRQEVELAKVELREKLAVLQRGMVGMAIGGALLVCALVTALWAVNIGLTWLLAQMLGLAVAAWLSPLILAVTLGALGWGMIGKGKRTMAREGLAPRATRETLREDARWARTKAHEVKEEMVHGR